MEPLPTCAQERALGRDGQFTVMGGCSLGRGWNPPLPLQAPCPFRSLSGPQVHRIQSSSTLASAPCSPAPTLHTNQHSPVEFVQLGFLGPVAQVSDVERVAGALLLRRSWRLRAALLPPHEWREAHVCAGQLGVQRVLCVKAHAVQAPDGGLGGASAGKQPKPERRAATPKRDLTCLIVCV